MEVQINEVLIAETYLPIGLLLSKSFDSFSPRYEVVHIKVKRIENIVIRDTTFNFVEGGVWRITSARYHVVKPIAIVRIENLVRIATQLIIQLVHIKVSFASFFEETSAILFRLSPDRRSVESFTEIKIGP